eukprot:532094_1
MSTVSTYILSFIELFKYKCLKKYKCANIIAMKFLWFIYYVLLYFQHVIHWIYDAVQRNIQNKYFAFFVVNATYLCNGYCVFWIIKCLNQAIFKLAENETLQFFYPCSLNSVPTLMGAIKQSQNSVIINSNNMETFFNIIHHYFLMFCVGFWMSFCFLSWITNKVSFVRETKHSKETAYWATLFLIGGICFFLGLCGSLTLEFCDFIGVIYVMLNYWIWFSMDLCIFAMIFMFTYETTTHPTEILVMHTVKLFLLKYNRIIFDKYRKYFKQQLIYHKFITDIAQIIIIYSNLMTK